MKRVILLASIALLCASFAWAQQTAASSDQSGSSASPSGTIQGCVSGTDGNYMLSQDETGTMYKLVGSEDKLKSHVGHEVMITGQLTSAPDQGQGGSSTSANADGGSVIQVSDVKMIAKQCSRGTNSHQ
jgi:hypothetical protein